MTEGFWHCLKCGYKAWCPIDDPLEMCPKCSAKYEEYEVIQPHVMHDVIIHRLVGTDELNVVCPFVFCTSDRVEDVEKMDKVIYSVYRKMEQFSHSDTNQEGA